MNTLVIIACGSRNWTDRMLIDDELRMLTSQHRGLSIIVEGGAKGADRLAGQWAARARQQGIGWLRISAEWAVHHPEWCFGGWCAARRTCLAAGPRRNQQMLDYALGASQQYVVAFKDGFDLSTGRGGTEDMVRRSKAAGVHGKIVRHAARDEGRTVMPVYCPVCHEEPFFGPSECTACYEPCCDNCAPRGVCRECRKVGIT